MDKSYSIGDLMELYYERDIAQIEDIPLPTFSLKHKRKLKKAFKLFEKNKIRLGYGIGKENNGSIKRGRLRNMPLHKRIILAIIIIISLAFITGCVIAFISNSFKGVVYSDNTYLFANNTENCPLKIEKVYTLSVIPEGYDLYEVVPGEKLVSTTYINDLNQELVFIQTSKKEFNPHINTEGYVLYETFVNNCYAVCCEYEKDSKVGSLIIWDNNEYILELYTNLPKEEALDLAIINEINGF